MGTSQLSYINHPLAEHYTGFNFEMFVSVFNLKFPGKLYGH